MSLNFFKEISLRKKSNLILFLLICLLVNVIHVNSSNCDKVAALPKDFDTLLPQYEKLMRLHVSNYFFLDDTSTFDPINSASSTSYSNSLKIQIHEKSVFKLQVTPFHVGIEVRLKIQSESDEIILESGAGVPIDYTSYLPLNPGEIQIFFTSKINEDNGADKEIQGKTVHDQTCYLPYMRLDVYIEEHEHLKGRLHQIQKEADTLDEFDLNLTEGFSAVREQAGPDRTSDAKQDEIKTDLEAYKLTLPHDNGLQYYHKYNVSVIAEYNLNVPEEKIHLEGDNSTDTTTDASANIYNTPQSIHKYFLKIQIYSDFLLFGSYFLLLIRESDIDSLAEFQCLYDGKCFLSDRKSKNAIALETIVTPGNYRVLLVNLNMNYYLHKDSNNIRKMLNLNSIPISARIKIKYFRKPANRYNCEGRHLPQNLDYLMHKNENYFEYIGDIVMNLDKLYDEVDFSVDEDAFLRLITFYSQGNNIEIELYEIQSNQELDKLTLQKNMDSKENFLNAILHSIIPKDKKDKIEAFSKNSGESDGLVYPVRKGKRYKLLFNYENSFFDENERKLCEMFYLKLAIEYESLLKKIVPSSCSNNLNTAEIDTLLQNLENNHQVKDEYSFTTQNSQIVQLQQGIKYDPKNTNNDTVIYSKQFEIKQSVNLHVEVISDFVSSFIVPIIIPLGKGNNVNIKDINNVLHHKYKKLIFHENTLKLKLNKGKYLLILVNGLSQVNSEEIEKSHVFINNCMSFKLRVSSIKLKDKKMLNWECNYLHYDEIPDNLNNYFNEREKFTYFNQNLLLPGADNQYLSKTMKITTGSQGYFIRLVAEYIDKNESINNRDPENKKFEINLRTKGKIIKNAKEYIIDYDIPSDQIYLNYYLKANSEYEILFETNNSNEGWKFFEYCRIFKLEINLVRKDFLHNNTNSNGKCVVNTPKLEDVIYERLIDVDNSFYKYGTKSPLEMFITSAKKKTENGVNSVSNDLEVTHPRSNAFTFVFDAEIKSTGKDLKNAFSYTFEVKSYIAKATIIIENSSIIGISAKIRFLTSERFEGSEATKGSELIAAEDLEGQGLYTIRALMLPVGKYQITFYANTHYDKKYSNLISNQCVSFSASVLIENKPFDFAVKIISEKYETCPYLTFPNDLNIPGWIHADTDYTINEFITFKLKNNSKVKRFTLHERSLFKFHIPNDDNSLLTQMSLYKVKANKKQKLIEKLENNSNFISTILAKGTYELDFSFRGVQNSATPDWKNDCSFYNVYMAVIPISNIKGGVDSFNPENKNYCEEKGLDNQNVIKPNTFLQFAKMKLTNVQDKTANTVDEGKTPTSPSSSRIIKLLPSSNKGKFSAELIYNHYIDIMHKFIAYEINHKKSLNTLTEISFELIKYENFVWVSFHFDKNKEYQLEIKSTNFDNYSVCSNVVVSLNYEEFSHNSDIGDESMIKKDSCHVEDHLPSSFFTNTNNILNKYGGAQSETNGEINFLGEFLLPKSSAQIRSEFLIRQKSIVFIKIVPKYTHTQTSNIFIQIFKDSKVMYAYSHNEHNGMMLTELDPNIGNNNSNVTPLFIEINFDRVLSDCETYEFIFSVIPRNTYVEEYLSCDETVTVKIPNEISFDKTSQFAGASFFGFGSNTNDFTQDEEGNMFKVIKLILLKATTITAELEYIVTDNNMDIIIQHDSKENAEQYTDDILEIGRESFQQAPHLNGISAKKEIKVNLKKGHYLLKIIYHKFFTDVLKRYFEKEIKNICLGFNLQIEGVVLKNMKHDSSDEKDDDESDPELKHLSKNDFTMNYSNLITSIDPPELKNIKLDSTFNIDVKFAYSLAIENSVENETKYAKLIYIQDIHNESNGKKIYPSNLLEITDESISFDFEVTDSLEMMKCYKLHLDDAFKSTFDAEAIETLDHIYCTVNCDCNANSNFKCSSKGKCICYSPYAGSKCEQCIEGYVINQHGKCVDAKLQNSKCDDKLTCSGHGKCSLSSFDAFAITMTHDTNGPCACDENFTSYSSPKGYPATVFCNSCVKPTKIFPICGERFGQDSADSLSFNFESSCKDSEGAITLPSILYNTIDDTMDNTGESNATVDPQLEELGGGQESDGSLDLLAVFKVSKTEEATEVYIPEESIVRVFYESHEVNRAKVLILQSKYDTDAVAFTEGKEPTESFIAKLDAKSSPYYIKLMHNNLKYGCNRYRLKIVVKPLKLVLAELKCKAIVNNDKASLMNVLPPSEISIDKSQVFGNDKYFIIPDFLILNPTQIKNKSYNALENMINFTSSGVLSKGNPDEDFIYNIKLDVKASTTFSANALFDFLTSDISITLRDNTGKILKSGDWLIPEAAAKVGDNDFINGVQTILDPGVYYLAVVQNVPANHIMQIIHENEKEDKVAHVNRCFKFALHIQTTLINKPDPSLSTAKFESMYNRIVSVEPESMSNINFKKKFEIFVTFEGSIDARINSQNINQSFRDVFYMENIRNKEKIPATHVYLQGSLSKTFLIIYNENVMIKDECFELKYNLDLLTSSNDKDRRITSDFPITHRFCTKNCNCNPHTSFECDSNDKCICEEPYTGEACSECINGWYFARGKCISEANCKKNFCSSHGKCQNLPRQIIPTCRCDNSFIGKDCSSCQNQNDTFPDCESFEVVSGNTNQYDNFLAGEKEEVSESDIETNKCAHSFVPHNLDTLGYLHLDGNMHISGKYSLKHINDKHYSMKFTIKEKSHVKIYLEHTKSTHVISIFLLDNNKKLLHSGGIHVGPAGVGSASFIDFIIDPNQNSNSNNSYLHYEVNFYIKDIPANDEEVTVSYGEESEMTNLTDECFTVFLEMGMQTLTRELVMINSINKEEQCKNSKENLPRLIPPNTSLFDYHTVFYNSIEQSMMKYTHIRDTSSSISISGDGVKYFSYEYFYVPDHLDQELLLELEVYSKFISSQVGVMLEIVDIPMNEKIDHKKLNAKMIEEMIEKPNGGRKLEYPECNVHCFSGVKKFNSVLLSRILPSDTFFRVWFYDLSPVSKNLSTVQNTNVDADKIFSKCVNFEVLLNIKSTKAGDKSLKNKRESSLCLSPELPKNLNIKGFLGDTRYLEKWGFHILESFRIDGSLDTGSVHETTFELNEYHIMRLVVSHGRVDTDLELFSQINNEDILIARSNSKNFEDAVVIDIPPGKYKIVFKFFPPPSGFHKCESIKMEFSMDSFHNVQQNVDRMVARHQNNPKFNKIDLFEEVGSKARSLVERSVIENRYTVKLQDAFQMNKDDAKTYESSISISELTFVIEPEDSGKVEFLSFVKSDFLLLDANIYLSSLPPSSKGSNGNSSGSKEMKIVSGTHKKNMNMILSGLLDSGTYVISLRYYRKIHYSSLTDKKDVSLFRATFAELEFDAKLINRSKDAVSVLSSSGYLSLPPLNSDKSSISHEWLCRNTALPLPKTLNSLRYLEFNSDMHILDNYLVPPMGLGEEIIKFKLKYGENTMIRVYAECHSVDIDLELREVLPHNQYKLIAASKENIHFETLMQIINENKEYEIVIKFNGKEDVSSHMSASDPSQSCLTFKLEIAMEKSHNYACPNNGKYALLTDLKPIPEVLPVKETKFYKYDSRNTYLGDEKNSGYVYLLRSLSDKVIEYSQFTAESDIDFKVEIENDFMQAPVNIFLTTTNPDHARQESSKLASNALKLNDAYIVSYGEIFENRSTLLIKNLPKGSYTIYLYLPGLKTKFTNEPRVCSIYDILVEVKKSRSHFKVMEIIDKAEIREENLNLPVRLPLTLNSLKFMENEENYINYSGEFYLRQNNTVTEGNNYNLYNTIAFNIAEESLVEFFVNHDQLKESLLININGVTKYSEYTSAILKPGKYQATVKVEDLKSNIQNTKANEHDKDIFKIDYMEHLILFYIGIAPVNRVREIYAYNNLQSTYHQCKSMSLPQSLNFDEEAHTYNYHSEYFAYNKDDLKNLKIGKFTQLLKSNNNRVIVELGADYVLNKLSLVVKSEHKEWKTMWYNNQGDLDITVPSGLYSFELQVDEAIPLANLECIIFSLDIHIMDNDLINKTTMAHPLYSSHVFDSSHSNSRLLKPKCEGSVLPLELHSNADTEYHKIKDNGDYLLHLSKAVYFNSKQHSQHGENLNEVDINLQNKSLVRIVTTVNKPNEFQIIPKLKLYSKQNKREENDFYIPYEISFVSHNLKERNVIWFLDNNKTPNDEFYTLELIQEKYEELTEKSNSYHCPYYTLDVLIQSVVEVASKMECLSKSNEVLQYILPSKEIPTFKSGTSMKPYHEKIQFSYFTEKQYGDNYVELNSFAGLQYVINFKVEDTNGYHLSLELGFDQVISLFDVYLSKTGGSEDAFQTNVIGASEPYFDKYDAPFPYKRLLTANLDKGVYVLLLVENLWKDINVNVKAQAGFNERSRLCLPFSYSLDIVSSNEKTVAADIISVFPPGPISFKSQDEDLNIKVILSKPAFTKKHEAITYITNFMNIINAFYLVKTSPKGKYEEMGSRIHPSKLEGAENNKEWNLLFMKDHFEPNYDYDLKLDSAWLYDVNYTPFKASKKMPIFRVETTKEAIFELVDSIKNMKNQMNDSDFKVQKDDTPDPHPSIPHPISSTASYDKKINKCGDHGKSIHDNILGKEACTCFDGFSGKFCQICEGIIDKKTNKCVIVDEDEEEDNEPESESVTKHTTVDTTRPPTNNNAYVPQRSDQKSCEGGCVNGFCDSKTGRCVCDVEYYGPHCDKLKNSESRSGNTGDNAHNNNTTSETLGAALLAMLYYFYKFIRKIGDTKPLDYNPLPSNEFEMSIGANSINSNDGHDLELVGSDNQYLVDYEIQTDSKYKRGNKKDVKDKRTEL